MRYNVHGLDVWGNERDGFDVNDVYPSHCSIEIADNATDEQIIRALKECGYLNAKCRYSSFEVDGEIGYTLYVNYTPTSRPLCELRAAKD